MIPKKFAFSFPYIFAHRVHIFLIYSTVFVTQLVATLKNGESLVITLDYDKNIYLSPTRSTANLAIDLDSSNKYIVDEDLNNALIAARDMQWSAKRAAPGYKIKRVKWYLLLDAFMLDYRDTCSFEEGPRMAKLLKNAKIKDNVAANAVAIESGMYDSSAASASSILGGVGLSDSSEDLDDLIKSSAVSQQAERMYSRKTPRPMGEIEALVRRPTTSKAAAGKQPLTYQGRGKVHIGYDHPMVHRNDHITYSEYNDSSDPEVYGTVTKQGSSKRKIKSTPRHERIAKKSKKTEKELSLHDQREMQKSIEEHSMVELDLGSSSLKSDRITTVKIDVMRMVEPNSQERVRDTDTEWVDVLVNTFKNRTSSMVAPICCIVQDLPNPRAFDVDKKHEYTYRTIGGNHSRTAFARLIATVSESTDPYMVSCWRYDFLGIKTFFYFFVIL